jgi:UDP-N-acetylglucosamine 2-epimerase (non-hydrolysing)
MAPVIAACRDRFGPAANTVVHTGQHYDRAMSEIFFEELGVPEPDHLLGVGSGTHGAQAARVIERLTPILESGAPDFVIVSGDVNSTLAAALAAERAGCAVAHVESGLRSFDRTMPEEINRIVTDHIAERLYTHSDEAAENLAAEAIAEGRVRFVGNTMIDTLVALLDRIAEQRSAAAIGVAEGEFILVTLHRPALVDGPLLGDAIERLAGVAAEIPVVFPVHPRTRARLVAAGWVGSEPGLHLIDPIGYLDFLSLVGVAAGVLTDSGGVQEETTFLGVPCFTLRDNTERPVTVRAGTNTLLGLDPARIAEIPEMLAASSSATPGAARSAEGRVSGPPPLWDGRAAERVADVLADW